MTSKLPFLTSRPRLLATNNLAFHVSNTLGRTVARYCNSQQSVAFRKRFPVPKPDAFCVSRRNRNIEHVLGNLTKSSASNVAETWDGALNVNSGEAFPSQQMCIVNFYHLTNIYHPENEVKRHRNFANSAALDMRGRIYITTQGVNAQYSAPYGHALSYLKWVSSQGGFEGLRWHVWPTSEHAFPKLRIQTRGAVLQLAGGTESLPITDPSQRAPHLSPREWRAMLEAEGGERPVVLDLRNNYEWDAGHFEGAERPSESNFCETPVLEGSGTGASSAAEPPLPAPLKGVDRDTPVMMYCTGGIRCHVYSPYLRKQGFRKVFALEGGIANYLKQEGAAKWKGSMFVFDDRLAIGPAGGGKIAAASDEGERLPAAVPCQLCGGAEAVLPHLNCANVLCNKLFIACRACSGLPCREAHSGCCCEECTGAPRLRRRRPDGTWEERTQEPAPDSPFLRSMEGPMTHRTRPRVVEPLRPAEAKAAEAL